MQATARSASVVKSTSTARPRLIRIVRRIDVLVIAAPLYPRRSDAHIPTGTAIVTPLVESWLTESSWHSKLDDCEYRFPPLPALSVLILVYAALTQPFKGSPMDAQSPNKSDAGQPLWRIGRVIHARGFAVSDPKR